MARNEIQITVTEDKNENLEPSEEPDGGPLTSDKPSDDIKITNDESTNLKSLRDADADPSTSDKPLKIQKVLNIVRSCYGQDCERYFIPTSVAIGPLNHRRETKKDSRIERGKEWKRKLAGMFIKKGEEENFYKNVKREIKNLRNCYNDIEQLETWNDEKLAWMFLVDGCALLQFIALDVYDAWEFFSDNDPVRIEKADFFLLENQLPYHLLEILIDSFAEFSGEELGPEFQPKPFFKELIKEFINRSFSSLSPAQKHQTDIDYFEPPPPHLLELLRRRLTIDYKGEKKHPTKKDDFWKTLTNDEELSAVGCAGIGIGKKSDSVPNKSKHWPSIRNVRELKDKGIHFKARENGGAITDIDFNERNCLAILTLAPIFLHDTSTVPLLLNLIAYELCPDFKETCKITSQLSFLNSLIDNGEDVKELRDAGVLAHGLGSDEAVAELFNKMSGILVPNLKIDLELRRNIHDYCNSKKSHLIELIHTYFRSTWSFWVFLSALAGLIMQGMQTYYSSREKKLP
ncbi:hypothetical protein SLEP1_g55350 [Rubroshorea leprosula]|uniref:Uncharacterized protein n=1 Tax=Rubroshorea leprosula TaxID=152421 RepID=A0AAV5MHN3_9ROSI|nr:hypothetical protein SLEP1_g55350 [Rubroshorea leprosula]